MKLPLTLKRNSSPEFQRIESDPWIINRRKKSSEALWTITSKTKALVFNNMSELYYKVGNSAEKRMEQF